MKQGYEKKIREIVATRWKNNSPEVNEQISKKILEFFELQMEAYNKYKSNTQHPHQLNINSKTGNVIFEEGTLIHCARECSYEKILSIKEKGIITGDFIDIPEDGESFFCADFYRASHEMESTEFFDKIAASDLWACRGPFSDKWKHCTKLAFIIDTNESLEDLANTDMYLPQNNKHVMQYVLNLLQTYREEKNGDVAAIPYGLPSNAISGIAVGDFLLQNEQYMKLLNNMFPNCYILNHEGKVFFDPFLSKEENDRNKNNCLANLQTFNERRTQLGNNVMQSLLANVPALTVDTRILGKQTLEEQKDTSFKDETEKKIDSQTRNINRDGKQK